MQENYIQLGALAAIFALAIREFFAYLKVKKSESNGSNGKGSDLSGAILGELRRMNDNHLHSLKEAIEGGNARLVDVIHNDNTKMIELLGEIKGKINQ